MIRQFFTNGQLILTIGVFLLTSNLLGAQITFGLHVKQSDCSRCSGLPMEIIDKVNEKTNWETHLLLDTDKNEMFTEILVEKYFGFNLNELPIDSIYRYTEIEGYLPKYERSEVVIFDKKNEVYRAMINGFYSEMDSVLNQYSTNMEGLEFVDTATYILNQKIDVVGNRFIHYNDNTNSSYYFNSSNFLYNIFYVTKNGEVKLPEITEEKLREIGGKLKVPVLESFSFKELEKSARKKRVQLFNVYDIYCYDHESNKFIATVRLSLDKDSEMDVIAFLDGSFNIESIYPISFENSKEWTFSTFQSSFYFGSQLYFDENSKQLYNRLYNNNFMDYGSLNHQNLDRNKMYASVHSSLEEKFQFWSKDSVRLTSEQLQDQIYFNGYSKYLNFENFGLSLLYSRHPNTLINVKDNSKVLLSSNEAYPILVSASVHEGNYIIRILESKEKPGNYLLIKEKLNTNEVFSREMQLNSTHSFCVIENKIYAAFIYPRDQIRLIEMSIGE